MIPCFLAARMFSTQHPAFQLAIWSEYSLTRLASTQAARTASDVTLQGVPACAVTSSLPNSKHNLRRSVMICSFAIDESTAFMPGYHPCRLAYPGSCRPSSAQNIVRIPTTKVAIKRFILHACRTAAKARRSVSFTQGYTCRLLCVLLRCARALPLRLLHHRSYGLTSFHQKLHCLAPCIHKSQNSSFNYPHLEGRDNCSCCIRRIVRCARMPSPDDITDAA